MLISIKISFMVEYSLTVNNFRAMLKQANFVNKVNISDFVKKTKLNTKFATLATKSQLKMKH